MNKSIQIEEIKNQLIDYHKEKGYKPFNSFPIISDDPTVLFVNASITPFKSLYDNNSISYNYAINQRCFRMGGANKLEEVGFDPYYHTFFEMFGSGTFGVSLPESIHYLLELLNYLGLKNEKVYFITPPDEEFRNALIENGVAKPHIFSISKNGYFWQEWKFGNCGPIGKGLTVVFSRSSEYSISVSQMETQRDKFVELMNLIFIHSKEDSSGKIIPLESPGFEVALGLERLVAVLENCNNYEISSIAPLVILVKKNLFNRGYSTTPEIARMLTDHLRSICILIDEGIRPNNKKQGYALRKLIRRTSEILWLSSDRIILIEEFTDDFCKLLDKMGIKLSLNSKEIKKVIAEENKLFIANIQKALRLRKKYPSISAKTLKDTYGLSELLIPLFEEA